MRRFATLIIGLLLASVFAGCGALQIAPESTEAPTARPAAVVATQTIPVATTVELATPTAEALPTPDEALTAAARVMVGGNVRSLPTTKGSVVLDQVAVGETVLLRMRLPDDQWFSIVTPRGVVGWSWTGLLDVNATVMSRLPVGTEDPAVVAASTPAPAVTDSPDTTATVVAVEPAATEPPIAGTEGPIMGAEPEATDEPASGSLIAYTDAGNIWLLQPTTGETRQATQNGASFEPTWTADRRGLLFEVRSDEGSGIYTMQVGDAEPKRVVDGPYDEMLPAAAPNGDIYYVRHVLEDTSVWEIVRHDPAGAGQVIYSLETGLCAVGNLDVSDTRWMLALGCGRQTAIMVGELAGGEGVDLGQQLALSDGCLVNGAWSRVTPDRLVVVQSQNCDGANASTITGVDVATGTPDTEPIYRGRGIFALDTSPDGKDIVFAQIGSGGVSEGLWLVDTGGQAEPRQILAVGDRPAWRP